MSVERNDQLRRHREAEGRVIDYLFGRAAQLAEGGSGFEAEQVAEAAGILAERGGHVIDPARPEARLVEPERRARAAGRYVPTRTEVPGETEYREQLLRVLAQYARQDGRPREAEALDRDADIYKEEEVWFGAGGYDLPDWPEGE